MNRIVASVEAEYRRYKALAEAAIAQVSDQDLVAPGPGDGNPIAVVCRHLAGNLRSRFTEFLAADGEKPWRRRDEEFERRAGSRGELLAQWEGGWGALLETLAGLTDADLDREVTIRGQRMRVVEALHRSLAHASYHVGQIVYQARGLKAGDWRWLSIPPGQSDQYNVRPTMERAVAHSETLRRS